VVAEQREWPELEPSERSVTAFGEDADGELYIMTSAGNVYKIVPETFDLGPLPLFNPDVEEHGDGRVEERARLGFKTARVATEQQTSGDHGCQSRTPVHRQAARSAGAVGTTLLGRNSHGR
jgi:hypothetical protein